MIFGFIVTVLVSVLVTVTMTMLVFMMVLMFMFLTVIKHLHLRFVFFYNSFDAFFDTFYITLFVLYYKLFLYKINISIIYNFKIVYLYSDLLCTVRAVKSLEPVYRFGHSDHQTFLFAENLSNTLFADMLHTHAKYRCNVLVGNRIND